MKKQLKIIIIIFLFINFINLHFCYAHQGRTDKNGGHKDNNNVSGLGLYHYHCGDYPAHLHENGICPYSNNTNLEDNTFNSPNVKKEESVTQNLPSNSSNTSIETNNSVKSEINNNIPKLKLEEEDLKENNNLEKEPIIDNNKTELDTPKLDIVEKKIEELKIMENNLIIKVGESKKIIISIFPTDAKSNELKWKSSDDKIVSVDDEGNIIGKSEGNVIITVEADNKKSTCKVQVEKENEVLIDQDALQVEKNSNDINTTSENGNLTGILGVGTLGTIGYLIYKKKK